VNFKKNKIIEFVSKNLWLCLGLLALFFGLGGFGWNLLKLLPFFNGFAGPFKMLLFVNLFLNLGSAILINKFFERTKNKIVLTLLTLIIVVLLLQNCINAKSTLFYYIFSNPYPAKNAVLAKLAKNNNIRIYPVTPERTLDNRLPLSLGCDYATRYKIHSISGFDDRLETSLKEYISYKDFIWAGKFPTNYKSTDEFDAYRKYGVTYLIVFPFDFSKQPVQESSVVPVKNFLNRIDSKLKLVANDKGIKYYKIDNSDPLAFINDKEKTPLPIQFSATGATIDISTLKPNTNITINMIWHKRYRAYINGKEILKPDKDEWLRMTVHVPQKGSILELKYKSEWALGFTVSIIFLMLTLLAFVFQKKFNK